jgi:hypothetical protein
MLGLRLIQVDASVHAEYIADFGEAGNQPRGVKRSEAGSRVHGGYYTAHAASISSMSARSALGAGGTAWRSVPPPVVAV